MNLPQDDPRVITLRDYVLTNMEYGEQIEHQNLAVLIGTNYGLADYYMAISAANDALATHGKILKSIPQYGYVVLEPNNYNAHIANMIRRGHVVIERARNVSRHAPESLMNEDQRRIHRRLNRRINSFADRVRETAGQIEQLANSSRTNNRRQRNTSITDENISETIREV